MSGSSVLDGVSRPHDWEWRSLWSTFSRIQESGKPDWSPLSVYLGHGVVPRKSREDNHNQLGEDLSRYLVVRPGDLVFNKLRTWQGGLGRSNHEGIVSPAYFVCRPAPGVDSRFVHYQLISATYLAELKRISKWMPPSQFDTPWDMLRRLPLLLPPLEEQRRIADFLDAETARIDSMSSRRNVQLSLMEERLMSDAVRRTGRVSVRTAKEAAGQHPVVPLRRVVRGVKTGATPPTAGPDVWSSPEMPNAIPWYGPSSFGDFLDLKNPVRHLNSSLSPARQLPIFSAGSVVVVGIGATAGKVGYLDAPGSSNQQITALIPARDVFGKFLAWQLWSAASELRDLAPYTTLPIINNEFLKSFPVAVPSKDEQLAAATELDEEAHHFQRFRAATERQRHLLSERRQALITAAVTGQFDVSAASGRGIEE